MDRPITKFYIGDDVNVIVAEWRITKRRLTSFYNINFPNCNFQRLCKKINFTWGFYLFRFRQSHSMLFDSNNIYEWVHMAIIRGGGGGGCHFSKIGKKCSNSGKRCLDCGQLWVKFLIWNAIFKSFQMKKPEILSCGTSFSRFVHGCVSKCPDSKKTSLL